MLLTHAHDKQACNDLRLRKVAHEMGPMSSRSRVPARLRPTIVSACIVQYSQLNLSCAYSEGSLVFRGPVQNTCCCTRQYLCARHRYGAYCKTHDPLTCILAVSFSDLGNVVAASIVRFVSVARLMPLQVLRPAGHTLPIAFPGVSLYPATHYTDYAQP